MNVYPNINFLQNYIELLKKILVGKVLTDIITKSEIYNDDNNSMIQKDGKWYICYFDSKEPNNERYEECEYGPEFDLEKRKDVLLELDDTTIFQFGEYNLEICYTEMSAALIGLNSVDLSEPTFFPWRSVKNFYLDSVIGKKLEKIEVVNFIDEIYEGPTRAWDTTDDKYDEIYLVFEDNSKIKISVDIDYMIIEDIEKPFKIPI